MRAWGEAEWTGPRFEKLLRGVVRRVLASREPQPWWMPRRVLTVVSADVDAAAGVGAIWIVWRPKSPRMRDHIALLEWYGEQWRYAGGSSGSGDDLVDADALDALDALDVLDVRDGGGALSLTRRLDPPRSITTAPWIGCAQVCLGRDVDHVVIGGRRLENPEHRRLIAVWTSPATGPRDRPVIVALGSDGVELSRMGLHDGLDSHTWARVREEL